jgi:hypothetical protein
MLKCSKVSHWVIKLRIFFKFDWLDYKKEQYTIFHCWLLPIMDCICAVSHDDVRGWELSNTGKAMINRFLDYHPIFFFKLWREDGFYFLIYISQKWSKQSCISNVWSLFPGPALAGYMYVSLTTHPNQSLTTFNCCLMHIAINTILFSVTDGHVQHHRGTLQKVNNMAV